MLSMEKKNAKINDINQTKNASEHTVASESNKLNFFIQIAEAINKYGKGTVAFSVIILFLVLNLIINPINLEKILDKWNTKTEMEHKLGLKKRQNADILIPSILNNLLLKTNADRVMLLEFHNSGMNKSNLPFFHFSATYEVIDEYSEKIEYVADQYYYQRTGDYSNILEKLKKVSSIYYDDIQLEQPDKVVKRLEKNGVRSAYITSVYDDGGQLVGIMTITSDTPDKFNHNELMQLTAKPCQQIGHLLTGITNNIK